MNRFILGLQFHNFRHSSKIVNIFYNPLLVSSPISVWKILSIKLATNSNTRAFKDCDSESHKISAENTTTTTTWTPNATEERESAFKRTFRVLKEDLWNIRNSQINSREQRIPSEVDIAIIGGGIMGSSIAYWLKQRAPESFNLIVLERDPTYTCASTTLSVGGIRQQFSLPENIQLSLFSASFLRNIKRHLSVLDQDPPDIAFQPHGYLFLATEDGAAQMEANHKLQVELGAKIDLLSPSKLKEKFPWIRTDGIALASHGLENEGWFDPWSLLSAFKRKAISLGAQYVDGEVINFEFDKEHEKIIEESDDPYYSVNHLLVKTKTGDIKKIKFAVLIVAAGPSTGQVAKMLRIGTGPGILKPPLPVEPRKRYVYVVKCREGLGIDFPLMIDPSGVYCRREGLGGNYVCGKSPSPSEEPDGTDLDVDYTFFNKSVWPVLAERVPAFEKIKMLSAWAGFYDYNTLDQNAIVGHHPYYNNIFFATGFSGHGIQMAPGVGRAVMELILDGSYESIDLTRFGVKRVIMNEPLLERNIV